MHKFAVSETYLKAGLRTDDYNTVLLTVIISFVNLFARQPKCSLRAAGPGDIESGKFARKQY